MKCALLVVLLAAAATAAGISNDVPDVVEVPDVDEVADEDLNEVPEEFVIDATELTDRAETLTQTTVVTRRNLILGSIACGDTRVFNEEYKVDGIAGQTQMRYIGHVPNRPISAIRVKNIGPSQNATASIIDGGIGSFFVTIWIQSALDRGYHYRVQIYVR